MAERRTVRSGLVSAAAAVAVLVSLCSLMPIVQGARWWASAAVFVVVAVAASSLGRRAGLPVAAAALVALATVPLVATALFGGGAGLLLVVPTETSAMRVLQGFQDAATQIYTDATPATGSPALALLIGASAGVAAVVVDAVAVGLRAPLAGMLVVAALALVPGKALGTGTQGLLLVAVAAAVLLVVAADRRRRGSPSRLPGLAAAGGIAIVLTLVAQVVLPTPYATQAQGVAAPLFGSGVDPLIRLGENLRRGATVPVLTYTTTAADKDVYLRLAVLEDFSGEDWSPNEADGRPLRFSQAPDPAGLATARVTGTARTAVVPAATTAIGERLPLPYPATSVSGVDGADFRWEQRGLTLIRNSGDPVAAYSVESRTVDTSAAVLRRSATTAPGDDAESVTLPLNTPAIIRSTARAWTSAAATPYDKALAIQNRLRDGAFIYDENTPAEQGYDGDGLGVIATFLRVKAGYCIHYASTMAVMARLEGIPSRIVVGYQPGIAQAGRSSRLVTSDALHAWPELYFDDAGWVRFEPTPGQGVVPAYAPVPTTAATPTPTDSAPVRDEASPQPSDSTAATGGATGGDAGAVLGPVLRGGGIALLVLALLAVPGLLRRTLRRRRLGPGGGEGTAGPWHELIDSLTDLGLPTGGGRSPRAVEEVLAQHVGTARRPRAALERIRTAYERQAYSAAPVPIGADDVRIVVGAAAERAGRWRRLIAAVAPRSLIGTLTRSRLAFRWSPSGSD